MNPPRVPCRARRALLVALLGGAIAHAGDDDPAAREWNQPRGNAARTAAVAVLPVTAAEPRIAWQEAAGSEVLSEPVTWGGVVYVAVRRSATRERELQARRVENGELIDKATLGGGDRVDLLAWQGTVVVASEKELAFYSLKGARPRFAHEGRLKVSSFATPCLYRGFLFVADGQQLRCIQVRNRTEVATVPARVGTLAVATIGDRCEVVGAATEFLEDWKAWTLLLLHVPVLDLEKGKPRFGAVVRREVAPFKNQPAPGDMARASLVRLAPSGGGPGGWLVSTPVPVQGSKGDYPGITILDPGTKGEEGREGGMSSIATIPGAHQGVALGFSAEGTLIKLDPDGGYLPVVEGKDLRRGARPGPATLAGGVAYFGNWAVEVEGGRVLWCLEGHEPATATVPIADRRALFGTKKGELVCLGDAAPAAAAAGSGAPSTAAAGPTPSPLDLEGVLLSDGRRLEGSLEFRGKDRLRVSPGQGEAVEVELSEVALAHAAGRVLHRGEEFPVFDAWRGHLDAATVESLAGLFDVYRKVPLVKECRRLLEELRRSGERGKVRADALEPLLTTRLDHPNADLQFKRMKKEEDGVRATRHAAALEASQWCAERQLPLAATALLALADRVAPGTAQVEDRARALLPPGYPWKDRADAGRSWVRWAEEILPAGGEFVPRDDAAWKRAEKPPWKEEAIALRTRNLLFFSTTHDPAVVGACLRNGEGGIRALERLLEVRKRDGEALDVRLHKDREGYLAENTGIGTEVFHTAGYYSPSDRVSRFFLPSAQEHEAPLRELCATLVHELTHHYVDRRWAGGDRAGADAPGFWIVEGFARFIDNQVVEMGRRGLRLDDTTVSSLETIAALEPMGKLFGVRSLVDMTHEDYAKLEDKDLAQVQLRSTLGRVGVSPIGLFYEEAGSLVFFLLHRSGEAGRKAVIGYMRDYYAGKTAKEGWKKLGFGKPEELDAKFREFLKTLRN